nr:MAG TPA: hypothetical protein [Caudoviricetes sp.]
MRFCSWKFFRHLAIYYILLIFVPVKIVVVLW